MRNNPWIYSLALLALVSCGQGEETTSVVQDQPEVVMVKTPMDSINEVLSMSPNDIEALLVRAKLYVDEANLPYALADAKTAMDIDSTHEGAMITWGELNVLANQTRISRDVWLKCANRYPENVEVRVKLAELYAIVFEYDKAMARVDEAIALDDSYAPAFYLKGLIVRDHEQDTTGALAYIQHAIDLDPEYLQALEMAGVLLASQGNGLALSYFDRILELRPDDPTTLYHMGSFHHQLRNWNEAIITYTRLTEVVPQHADAWYNLGYIYYSLGELAMAREHFSNCIQIEPQSFRGYYARGICWEDGGDAANAEADFREALSRRPNHDPSKMALQRLASRGPAQ